MKTYTGKTVDDAVSKACLDLGVTIDQLNYEVTLETKGLFSKKAEIACWTVEMVQEYIENLIRKILTDMQFELFLMFKMVEFIAILIQAITLF